MLCRRGDSVNLCVKNGGSLAHARIADALRDWEASGQVISAD